MRTLLAWSLAAVVGLLVFVSTATAETVPGQVVVRFSPWADAADRADALDAIDAVGSTAMAIPGTRVVRIDPADSVERAAETLALRPGVMWAEPNYVVRPQRTPNDPDFLTGALWGLENTGQTVPQLPGPRAGTPGVDIGAPRAWDVTTGSSQVLVGVVDSGIAVHDDLDANVRLDLSRSFRGGVAVAGGDPTADVTGHGTHVAGTIGAVGDNGTGVTGVNWQVGLVALDIMENGSSGTSADIAAGFAYAGQIGLPIVNASLGSPGASQVEQDAIRQSPNTLFVVAAGNDSRDNDGTPFFPCSLPEDNVVCVASIGNTGLLSPFSNWGATSVDLGAPGEQILSTFPVWQQVDAIPIADPLNPGWTPSGPDPLLWRPDAVGGNTEIEFGPLAASTDSAVLESDHVIDLTGRRGCSLQGDVLTDFGPVAAQPEAWVTYERSTDDGATWTAIGSTDTTSAPNYGQPLFSLRADGEAAVLVRVSISSTAAFTAATDPAVAIRSLTIHCLDDAATNAYQLQDGTSMASPQVAGAAALLLARRPGATVAQLRAALLSSVTALPALSGITVTGGRLDVPAALAAISPAGPPASTPEPAPPVAVPEAEPEPVPAAAASTTAAVRAPALRARFTLRRQNVERRRAVLGRLNVNQPARVTVTGRLQWRGGTAKLAAARRTVAGGRTVRLSVRVSGRALRRVARVQGSGRRVVAVLRVRVTPLAGGPSRTVARRVVVRVG